MMFTLIGSVHVNMHKRTLRFSSDCRVKCSWCPGALWERSQHADIAIQQRLAELEQ
jgi:hypothetical protein